MNGETTEVYKKIDELPMGSFAWLDMVFSLACFTCYADFQKKYWDPGIPCDSGRLYPITLLPSKTVFEKKYYPIMDNILFKKTTFKELLKELDWILN